MPNSKVKKDEIVKRELLDLVDFEDNPRMISEADMESLKRSLTAFGYVDKLIIDEKDRIIGGNQRARAMRELGWEGVIEVVRLSGFSEEELIALNIALNRISGDWDYTLLKKKLAECEIFWEQTGFGKDELALLMQKMDATRQEVMEEDLIEHEAEEKRIIVVFSFSSADKADNFLEDLGQEKRMNGKSTLMVIMD